VAGVRKESSRHKTRTRKRSSYLTALALTTMTYEKENRLVTYLASGTSVSYTYSGDSLKRSEWNAGTPTTLVWDGQDYLEGRS